MGLKDVAVQLVTGIRASRGDRLRERKNRVSPALSSPWEGDYGVGQEWTPLTYGEYYPRSAMVYAALKLRQDAVARPPLKVYRRSIPAPGSGKPGNGSLPPGLEPAGADHPVQRLLDAPNRFWTRGDLWRATETYMGLWGSAYWGLERDETGCVTEIWPLRPDRMRVLPDAHQYIKGFVYVGQGRQPFAYLPEDIVWFRYFNPLDEYAGLSPVAHLRLSADMGMDALRASRSALTNDSTPGLYIETSETPTDDEVSEFYERWEARFKGVERVRRPALLSSGMKVTNLGFSPREMEYIQSLRWSLEDVARVFRVPKPMLADMERVTFSNFITARNVFWQDTIVPQLSFYEETLRQMLLPALGDPSLSVAFDTSVIEALQENENDKAIRWQGYVASGIMTINEVRRELNLPPLKWGDGKHDDKRSATSD